MNLIRIGRPGARSERPGPGTLAGPARPGHRPGHGRSPGRAFRKAARDMMAWAGGASGWWSGRRSARSGWPTMSRCACGNASWKPAGRRRSPRPARCAGFGRWTGTGSSAARPGPGPGRNGAVTRAGGRRQDPGLGTASGSARNIPGRRTVTSRSTKPGVMWPPAPARQRPVPAIGEEHPGTPPPGCSSPGCRWQPAEYPGQGAARVQPTRAHQLHLPLRRRRRTPAASKPPAQQEARACTRWPRPVALMRTVHPGRVLASIPCPRHPGPERHADERRARQLDKAETRETNTPC